MDLAINNVTNLCNFVGKMVCVCVCVCVCVWVYLELLSHFLPIRINLTNISPILLGKWKKKLLSYPADSLENKLLLKNTSISEWTQLKDIDSLENKLIKRNTSISEWTQLKDRQFSKQTDYEEHFHFWPDPA